MLRDEVEVRRDGCFGKASGARAREPTGGRVCTGGEVVEADPVFFPMLQKVGPASESIGTYLRGLSVEDTDTCFQDSRILGSLEERVKKLRLGDEEFGLGDLYVVSEFMRRIAWICPRPECTCSDDGENQERIVDVVERVDDHAVSSSNAGMTKAGN